MKWEEFENGIFRLGCAYLIGCVIGIILILLLLLVFEITGANS